MSYKAVLSLLLLSSLQLSLSSDETLAGSCSLHSGLKPDKRLLYYDTNRAEGFNLLRDVYMRLAVFVRKHELWMMVLPPWSHLHHWHSDLEQHALPWSTFFDVESMKRFAPVVELQDVETNQLVVELGQTYRLQHFDGAFSRKNWDWSDRFKIVPCNQTRYREDGREHRSTVWGFPVRTEGFSCVSFQGGASLLGEFITQTSHRKIFVDRAEIVLHDRFGDRLYWQCRRSLRFARHLIDEANAFRRRRLNSWNEADDTILPALWDQQKGIDRKQRGGPFVCAHLRRQDFLHGRQDDVPTLDEAANTLIEALTRFNLTTVFLATDGTREEKSRLVQLLGGYDVVTYEPSADRLSYLKDGGVAIIDQIICSASRYFVGTHESTFSFRIQEEREILGFPVEHTFNRFCGRSPLCGFNRLRASCGQRKEGDEASVIKIVRFAVRPSHSYLEALAHVQSLGSPTFY